MADTYANSFENLFPNGLFGFDSTTGQIIPQTSDVKNAVRAALIEAFGVNLNTEDETPAGRLIEMWTMMMTRFCAVTALYANQLNPNYATGQMLDAVGALFSISRNARTYSVINCTFGGTAGVFIPQGSRISDNNGHEFTTDARIEIGANGTAVGTATCTTPGPLVFSANTVTTVLDTIVGWNYVTNDGTMVNVGYDTESDYHFRQRVLDARWTGTAFLEDIHAEVLRVDKVDSAFVAENPYGSYMYLYTDTNGQITLHESAPSDANQKYMALRKHSIVVIVAGSPASADVADAIYATKSAGSDMCKVVHIDGSSEVEIHSGMAVTQAVVDPNSSVSYTITYNKAYPINFGVNVEVARNKYVGTDEELEAQVKSAISSWANGDITGVDGIQLGQSIYSFEIGAAISDVIPSIQVKRVKLVSEEEGISDPAEVDELPIFVYEIGSLDPDGINVTIV